jgi:hypothetical protein
MLRGFRQQYADRVYQKNPSTRTIRATHAANGREALAGQNHLGH